MAGAAEMVVESQVFVTQRNLFCCRAQELRDGFVLEAVSRIVQNLFLSLKIASGSLLQCRIKMSIYKLHTHLEGS